jgi:hypothetical protein
LVDKEDRRAVDRFAAALPTVGGVGSVGRFSAGGLAADTLTADRFSVDSSCIQQELLNAGAAE